MVVLAVFEAREMLVRSCFGRLKVRRWFNGHRLQWRGRRLGIVMTCVMRGGDRSLDLGRHNNRLIPPLLVARVRTSLCADNQAIFALVDACCINTTEVLLDRAVPPNAGYQVKLHHTLRKCHARPLFASVMHPNAVASMPNPA